MSANAEGRVAFLENALLSEMKRSFSWRLAEISRQIAYVTCGISSDISSAMTRGPGGGSGVRLLGELAVTQQSVMAQGQAGLW